MTHLMIDNTRISNFLYRANNSAVEEGKYFYYHYCY